MKTSCFHFKVSRHAQQRIKQRGVIANDFDLFMDYADLSRPVKNGCEEWILSAKALKALRLTGISAQQIERVARIRTVIDGCNVVTVTKCAPP